MRNLVIECGTLSLSRSEAPENVFRDRNRAAPVEVWSSTIWPCPRTVLELLRKFSHTYDRNLVVRKKAKWRGRHQRNDLQNIYVCVHECRCTSRKRSRRTSTYCQEHEFRRYKAFIQHRAKIRPWSRTWINVIFKICWDATPWMRCALLHEDAIK